MIQASGTARYAPGALATAKALRIHVGQCSDKGAKRVNQDFHGYVHPHGALLARKGVVIALADGISSSEFGQVAAETAVKSFLEDYYATSEAWSVKTAAQRVLAATNSWLHAQSRHGPHRFDLNRGYVCTFSGLVLKANSAHLFHIGDARIVHLSAERLEPLTEEHRLWVSDDKHYLSRALGMRERLELDYRRYSVEEGTTLVLMTDGVHEHVNDGDIARLIRDNGDDLDLAARRVVDRARDNGSEDNLTIQIVRVDQLPAPGLESVGEQAAMLPFPPELRAHSVLDDYRVLRNLHSSARSHVYLADDRSNGRAVVVKVPAVDQRANPDYLERFLAEEWIARRLDNPHLLKAEAESGRRSALYTVFEYLEGQTLEQWMLDNPQPALETVRAIVEQIARGLRALHRQEMIHQDLRPANVMIDRHGGVKIIDFGSVRVAGIAELGGSVSGRQLLGTAQYTAPEYFLGEPGTPRSDLFSLGVITYQMLTGRLPYGAGVARATSRAAQRKLRYRPIPERARAVPGWLDGCLKKAVQINPARRYDSLSEFLHDLRQPNPAFVAARGAPLIERHPLLFWKLLSLSLFLLVLALLLTYPGL